MAFRTWLMHHYESNSFIHTILTIVGSSK